jgi:hypothetical protein
MNFQEAYDAINDAKETIRQGDLAAKQLAGLLVGRLRVAHVPPYVLGQLKKELRDFNTQTSRWKDPK